MDEKISIIIPIYNAEQYLTECLQSVINQTYRNLEIILVNDGSTDGSQTICESFVKKDTRVTYLYQENKGVTSARKLGLEYATGRYVGFVDSDDFVDWNLYEELASIIKEQNEYGIQVDLFTFGMKQGYEKEDIVLDKVPKGNYSTVQEIEYVIDNMLTFEEENTFGILPGMCCKLWERNKLKQIMGEMEESIFWGEDMICLYKFLLISNRIFVSDICGYHYRMRENSAVHSVNKRYLQNIDLLYNELWNVFVNHTRKDRLLEQLDKRVGRMIANSGYYMGMNKSCGLVSYFFPRVDLIAGKRIVLYGAGKVGHGYYMLFKKTNCCQIVRWIDSNIKGKAENGIYSVESIRNVGYDYIVIAVKSSKTAEEIRERLNDMGVEQNKILWECPCE